MAKNQGNVNRGNQKGGDQKPEADNATGVKRVSIRCHKKLGGNPNPKPRPKEIKLEAQAHA